MSSINISCPNCRQIYLVDENRLRTNFELEWSNEFGIGHYSAEGYSNYENHSLFTKCIQCDGFFWKDEAIKVEKELRSSITALLKQAQHETISKQRGFQKMDRDPQFVEGWYDEVLSKELQVNRELYVRKKFWWHYCNYKRGIGKMQYYPMLKEKCLSKVLPRGVYHLARLVKWAPRIPQNFQFYVDAIHLSRQDALTNWLISIVSKMDITFSEDMEHSEDESPPEPEFTGCPSMNDLIFYEKEWRDLEKANFQIQENNLNRLILLLDDGNSTHSLMKAEAMRQIGNFNGCAKLLESLSSPVATAIRLEASKRNSNVLTTAFPQYDIG